LTDWPSLHLTGLEIVSIEDSAGGRAAVAEVEVEVDVDVDIEEEEEEEEEVVSHVTAINASRSAVICSNFSPATS
jgi:hypothetical protein